VFVIGVGVIYLMQPGVTISAGLLSLRCS